MKAMTVLLACVLLAACGGRVEYSEASADPLSPPVELFRDQYPEMSARHPGCITVWNANMPPGCYPAGDDGVPKQCVAAVNPRIVFMDPAVTCLLSVNFGCDCGNQVLEERP